MNKPNDIIDLLFMIKKRPGAYIGKRSIVKLKSFLDGYCCALIYENINYNLDIYYSFNEWLAERYNINSVVLWDTYLVQKTKDEALSFDLFFEELEIFLRENNIEIPKIN